MKMSCLFGHKWNGCKCERCGTMRDEGHDYRPVDGLCQEQCAICGKRRETAHPWKGCKCERCGAIRDEGHDYRPVDGACEEACAICGKRREMAHAYEDVPGTGEKRCVRCGKKLSSYALEGLLGEEKGAIQLALKMAAARARNVPGGAEAVRMMEDYIGRIDKDGRFTREELCNIGLASQSILKTYKAENAQEMLFMQTLKTPCEKLSALIEKCQ